MTPDDVKFAITVIVGMFLLAGVLAIWFFNAIDETKP